MAHFGLLDWIKERFGRARILGRSKNVIVARPENPGKGAEIIKLHNRLAAGRTEGEMLEHLALVREKEPSACVTPDLCFSYPVIRDPTSGRFEITEISGHFCEDVCVERSFWVLGMEDVRIGRDKRVRRLARKDLQAATRVLAAIHHGPMPEFLVHRKGWDAGWRRLEDRRTAAGVDGKLRENLCGLVYIGDSLCHNDLHPSNWILKGVPIGLLDWAAAGAGDPENDLAGLLLAVDTRWAELGQRGGKELESQTAEIVETWESDSRRADPGRLSLYLWLAVVEELFTCENQAKDHDRRVDLLSLLKVLEREFSRTLVLLGSVGRSRDDCREVDVEGGMDLDPERDHDAAGTLGARWEAAKKEEVEPLREALEREGMIRGRGWVVEAFARHACNDVVRFKGPGGESFVAKVYNKPVAPFLFRLESNLASFLDHGFSESSEGVESSALGTGETRVCVPAPMVLPSGRRVFRVENRLAVLYRDYGDRELKNSKKDLEMLARGQAAFHRAGFEVRPYLGEGAGEEPLDLGECLAAGNRLAKTTEERESLAKAVSWLGELIREAEETSETELIPAFLHGSFHRDHCLLDSDRGVVVFDLEKASWGPRIRDVAVTAYYMGYRCNDEKMDPSRMAFYFLCYGRAASPGLTRVEKNFAVAYLMRAFFHDLRVLGREGGNTRDLRRHFLFLLDFFWNRKSFREVLHKATV